MKTNFETNATSNSIRPKIIVSIIEKTESTILEQAKKLSNADIDVIEWRADYYEDVLNNKKLSDIILNLKAICVDKLLLVTYRRKFEGGVGTATSAEYQSFCKQILLSEKADLLDIELSVGIDFAQEIIENAKKHNCKIVLSKHDFDKTPALGEMIETFSSMQSLGADVIKIAVMPHNSLDVCSLLEACAQTKAQHKDATVIGISMGELGTASRICGATFGSAMTFACMGAPSAPGQISIEQMNNALDTLYGKK